VCIQVVEENQGHAIEIAADENTPPCNLAFGCAKADETVDRVLPILAAFVIEFIKFKILRRESVEKEISVRLSGHGRNKGHVAFNGYASTPPFFECGIQANQFEKMVLLTANEAMEDQSLCRGWGNPETWFGFFQS